MTRHISRRTVLKGFGTALALPLLDAMQPLATAAKASGAAKPPVRMALVYVPNGVHIWRLDARRVRQGLPSCRPCWSR